MITLTEALNCIDIEINKKKINLPFFDVPLSDSLNRVLARPQFSRVNLPPTNISAVDGYALLEDDFLKKNKEYFLTNIIAAGSKCIDKLTPKTTIKVMTGAIIPDNTAIIIPIEMVNCISNRVKIVSWPNKSNIIKKASYLNIGDKILDSGKVLDPISIGNLASCGINFVPVYNKLKIAIISTGNEIVSNFDEMQSGQIIDANNPMLNALCIKYGLEIVMQLHLSDDFNIMIEALKKASECANIIIFSGGISVGDYDFVLKTLKHININVHFNKVSIKPGKPITFASSEKNIIFALPGKPVAAFFTFFMFVLYAIKGIYNINKKHNYIELPLFSSFERIDSERLEYIPSYICNSKIVPIINENQQTNLSTLLEADGFFVMNKGISKIKYDSIVKFLDIRI